MTQRYNHPHQPTIPSSWTHQCETGRGASACIRRHQAYALTSVFCPCTCHSINLNLTSNPREPPRARRLWRSRSATSAPQSTSS
jgi:hypothetical protein